MVRELAVSAGLLMLLVGGVAARAEAPSMVGSEAPGFKLPSVDGEFVSLEDLRGRHVVLHFGAGW